MEFIVPEALAHEHEELHADLLPLTTAPGEVGKAAREVARALHAHFPHEEEYAMPPLGLLAPVAAGNVSPGMADVLKMTDKLKAEFPRMVEEHEAIVAALDWLEKAGREENQPDAVAFSSKLRAHAQVEEQVLYPAAIILGEYLKVRGIGR
ncbi:MAG: hemerythrin domain-containing protein [Chloroflexota bacterium]